MNSDGTMDSVLERIRAREADPEWQREVERRAAYEQADIASRRVKTLSETGIPTRFLEILAAGPEETDATRALLDMGDGVVVLSGLPGCGKTIASCAWIREAVFAEGRVTSPQGFRGRVPMFVTSARLSRWDRYDNSRMDDLLKANRLVIDDVGSEFADQKGNFNAILDELVSDRHANRRPLVMTTNLDAAAFKARYDERIADRIREVGRFVSLDGSSMRKRAVG